MDWKQLLAYITGSVDEELLLRYAYLVAENRILRNQITGCVPLPPQSPNLNAYAERWVRSVKEETLSRLILFGERSLRHALTEYVTHFHQERPHQGKGNLILIPAANHRQQSERPIRCYKRLGGLGSASCSW